VKSISKLNHLLDGNVYVKISLFQSRFYHITLTLPASHLQKQQLITSQISSLIEYLIQTYNILLLNLHLKLMKNKA